MKEMLGMMDDLFYQPVVTTPISTTTYTETTTTFTTTTYVRSSMVVTTTNSSTTVTSPTTTVGVIRGTTTSVFVLDSSFKRFEILTSELEKSPLWDVELSSYQHFLDNSDGTNTD
jgi:hypothetical protein